MNLKDPNMLRENIKEIISDLDRYADKNRDELYTEFINYKLTNTLKHYNDEIEYNSDRLIKSESVRVLKAITKIQKRQDVENIKIEIENAKKEQKGSLDD